MYTQATSPMQYTGSARQMAASQGTSDSGDSSQKGDGLSVGNLDTTFLQLLITELKSQDPMSPMDGTQMVAQMVSLNQLDQLIGIKKTLDSSLTKA